MHSTQSLQASQPCLLGVFEVGKNRSPGVSGSSRLCWSSTTELTLVSPSHPPSWTSHTSLPEPPWIRRVSAAHPERINSMRLQTSPPTKLLPAAAGDVLCPCSSSVWSQLDGSGQRHMEDQSHGHRSRNGHTSITTPAPVTQCRALSLLSPHTGKCLPPGTAKGPMAHPQLLPLH